MKQQPAVGVPVGQADYHPPVAPPHSSHGGPPPPQPPHQTYQGHPPNYQGWSTGLCDCFDDVPNCCITCWCPCITFGQNAEIIDKGSSSCGVSGALYALIAIFTGSGCQFIYSCTYRSKLKLQSGMPESCLEDCCTHFWCECCALCQIYRELQHRGFDVPLGWHGNMEKRNNGMGVINPPNVPGGMTR
ncbi:hypothetical protein RND81_10G125000 [Saponaria officinalis]|uniref:Uncharacterized protein n=1 Tax=Saponaria officinalis TaxID=3572 RepID=A0AAW1I1P6_SAPOF